MEANIRYCYDIEIKEHENDIRNNELTIIEKNDIENKPLKKFYKLLYRENGQIDKIEAYLVGKLRYFVQYSHKGNLIYITEFPIKGIHKQIKTIFDYSYGRKRLKERRFYNNDGFFSKMEVFGIEEDLMAIFYFREGTYYCIERFSASGRLVEVNYFNQLGLQIK